MEHTPLYQWTGSLLRKRLQWFQRRTGSTTFVSIGSVYASRGRWRWTLLDANASGSALTQRQAKEALLQAYLQVGTSKMQIALFNPDLMLMQNSA